MIAIALFLTASIFAIDVITAKDGAIAVLYITVILLVAARGRRYVIAAGIGSTCLTTVAFLSEHLPVPSQGALSRVTVSLIAIAVTTLLSLRDRSSRTTLGEQARILELSHDTVIIRDANDVILYWNDGAERLYGWSRQEAVGKICAQLLQCRCPMEEIDRALAREGQWSGEIVRTPRDGRRLVLASRWLHRRDPDGRPVGIIESSADLTEQRRAHARIRASEQRYRTIFDSAGFAAWESDWTETMRIVSSQSPSGEDLRCWLQLHPETVYSAIAAAVIRDANQAAVELFQATGRKALVGSNLCGRYLPDCAGAFADILAALASGTHTAESEVSLKALGGRIADVILRVTLLPDGERWSSMLVMAFDVTERNEARARIEQTSAELAHAARVSILGQLAASIAHEVNQPLTAIINYGKSAKRWLGRPQPELEEIAGCVDRMVANGTRAAEIVSRVRSLARKTTPQAEPVDLPELIEDAIALIQREARAGNIAVRRSGRVDLPLVYVDRVQIQQVLMNLLMNGIQAMRDVIDRSRELCIETDATQEGMVRVAVHDRGVGFPAGGEARIFEPFFTTKAEGMGMGLSICRSIIEAQGGRISASNNNHSGATVAFTLPTKPEALQRPELIS
ncbi:PAS domain-containing sensor histidine kinase [Nguyenibacter vanlangensis]|uniref:PAS domain-containing sensor histidine kinase n=1 Tax=Nguyenibacter vanlangensis TaxID=1216886 RepID=UPI001C4010B1|nr:ATP-binding protein [Nguyenibacter vanlangensis]